MSANPSSLDRLIRMLDDSQQELARVLKCLDAYEQTEARQRSLIKEQEDELEALRTRAEKAEDELEATEDEFEETEQELNTLINTKEEERDTFKERAEAAEAKLAKIEEELTTLKSVSNTLDPRVVACIEAFRKACPESAYAAGEYSGATWYDAIAALRALDGVELKAAQPDDLLRRAGEVCEQCYEQWASVGIVPSNPMDKAVSDIGAALAARNAGKPAQQQ